MYTFHTLSGTKNIALFLMVAVTFVGVSTVAVYAQSNSVENPQQGSLGLSGVVPGEPPSQAPPINTPVDGQTFTRTPVTVSGTCQAGLIIEVYKNNVFSGSTICQENNTFTVDVGLFTGQNTLFTRGRDTLGQQGPKSNTVTITYDPPVRGSDRQIAQPILLQSNVSFRGVAPGGEVTFPIQLAGGRGPYAVSVNWGDGNSDVISRSDTGNLEISHTYNQPGVYRIVAQATDDSDQTTFLQVTAVVGGDVDGGVSEKKQPARAKQIYVLWPLYVLAALIPVAFWLGDRHVKRRYK